MNTYPDRNEAIYNEIIIPLGGYTEEYDIDAIADQALTITGEGKNFRVIVNEDVDFWAIVEANAL